MNDRSSSRAKIRNGSKIIRRNNNSNSSNGNIKSAETNPGIESTNGSREHRPSISMCVSGTENISSGGCYLPLTNSTTTRIINGSTSNIGNEDIEKKNKAPKEEYSSGQYSTTAERDRRSSSLARSSSSSERESNSRSSTLISGGTPTTTAPTTSAPTTRSPTTSAPTNRQRKDILRGYDEEISEREGKFPPKNIRFNDKQRGQISSSSAEPFGEGEAESNVCDSNNGPEQGSSKITLPSMENSSSHLVRSETFVNLNQVTKPSGDILRRSSRISNKQTSPGSIGPWYDQYIITEGYIAKSEDVSSRILQGSSLSNVGRVSSSKSTSSPGNSRVSTTKSLHASNRSIPLAEDNLVRSQQALDLSRAVAPTPALDLSMTASVLLNEHLNTNNNIQNQGSMVLDLCLLQSILKKDSIPTCKTIPPSLRLTTTTIYSQHLHEIIKTPTNLVPWIELFLFPKVVFRCLSPGDPAYKLSSKKRKKVERELYKERLLAWQKGGNSRETLITELLGCKKNNNTTKRDEILQSANIKRCKRQAREDGQFRKAIQSLSSYGSAPPCNNTTEILRSKHPAGPIVDNFIISNIEALKFNEEEVLNALRSFPKGTACGRSGLRASHLLEMSGIPNEYFLSNLTSVINIAAAGKAPIDFAPYFMSAPLVPVLKKDGNIRPVAVGEILRRLISKLAMRKIRQKAAEYLSPLQVGVGVEGGIEAILHGFNRKIKSRTFTAHHVAIMVDFENAFNNINRNEFIRQVKKYFPELLPWVLFCYRYPAWLYSGEDIIEARAGVQQGDPLGPLLFALALQPLLEKLQRINSQTDEPAPIVVAYLDDISIISPSVATAKRCIDLLCEEGPPLGLIVSKEKTMFWQDDGISYELIDSVGNDFHINYEPGFELLGGVVSRDRFFTETIVMKRINKCVDIMHKLIELQDPQLCLLLLRSCLGMIKLNYCWRTTMPDALSMPTSIMSSELERTLKYIVTADGPKFGQLQIDLASLPIRFGGLGIFMPKDIIKYTFLASQQETKALQQKIFPSLEALDLHSSPLLEGYLSNFLHNDHQQIYDTLRKGMPLHKLQHTLASLYYKRKRETVIGEYFKRTIYHEYTYQHSLIFDACAANSDQLINNSNDYSYSLASQWLLALPNYGLGQVMSPREFRTALALRLLIPIYRQPVACTFEKCKQSLDCFGYHALSCVYNGFHARHEFVLQALGDLAQAAGFNPKINEDVICLGYSKKNIHKKKPADLLIDGDKSQSLCVDMTVVSPLSQAKADGNAYKLLGQLVRHSANKKNEEYLATCQAHGMEFLPFAVDVCGMIDKTAAELLQRFASGMAQRQGKTYSYTIALCRRKISFAIQHSVARQLVSLHYQSGDDDWASWL